MNRPQSRWEIRKLAGRAFVQRNRLAITGAILRTPDVGETPLSEAEILHGLRIGAITAEPIRIHQPEEAPQ